MLKTRLKASSITSFSRISCTWWPSSTPPTTLTSSSSPTPETSARTTLIWFWDSATYQSRRWQNWICPTARRHKGSWCFGRRKDRKKEQRNNEQRVYVERTILKLVVKLSHTNSPPTLITYSSLFLIRSMLLLVCSFPLYCFGLSGPK